ncbi:hypothetical protein GGS26DRAFT_587921 [Hypomontagnella submonticulosa]|nr:hypothetical protein GGS26DRAFT_587921 [Hypomontagnella submonticulosa]
MSDISKITALHAKASAILHPQDRAPTRVEYGEALELVDTAMDLAIEFGAGAAMIERCEAFQRSCYDPLVRAYSQAESFERVKYEKSTSKALARQKRAGKIFNTDAGEHSLEVLEAVHIGGLLDNLHFEETKRNCKIRWVDEVENRAIKSC